MIGKNDNFGTFREIIKPFGWFLWSLPVVSMWIWIAILTAIVLW